MNPLQCCMSPMEAFASIQLCNKETNLYIIHILRIIEHKEVYKSANIPTNENSKL